MRKLINYFLSHRTICPRCHGSGTIELGDDTKSCPVCKGKGTL